MKHNEQKGFILPVTLLLCLFVSLSLIHLLGLYVTEKKFYVEQGEIFVLESLMQMATADLIHQIGFGDINSTGEFYYEKGVAAYWILGDSHDTLNIQLKVMTEKGRQRFVTLLVDKEQLRVKEWIEITKE
ncbi:competence type IV pilus minor pilin ComGG [Alkalihalobacterium elongatum]|uniref:competence type IV pilus minor pilin ComGG n=1 Tax=Alkalihalobacterium elongatum TaxID=2675466 RepID=UPI001C1F8720|nr:competence type IV pilus minor pilin ComGG [Alkalihalobacterium elongatum]